MSNAELRPVDICACADDVTSIVHRSFATVAETLGLTPENCPSFAGFATTAENLAGKLGQDGCYCFGMFEGGLLIGFAALAPYGGGHELTRLAVLPEKRHCGYGRQLVNAVLDKARELGLPGVGLGMIDENTVLKEWYRTLGFTVTDTSRYPHLPFTVCAMFKSI